MIYPKIVDKWYHGCLVNAKKWYTGDKYYLSIQYFRPGAVVDPFNPDWESSYLFPIEQAGNVVKWIDSLVLTLSHKPKGSLIEIEFA